ncbi:MAG: hypothetical protein LBK99_19370 [Opitutaceae bacterium]|jgi:hypothetical protein|nr:hypothetical protein [Opitutaceae bacterium]
MNTQKNRFLFIALLLLARPNPGVPLVADPEAPPASGYGPAIPAKKIAGFSRCMAVAKEGNHLYVTGDGKLCIFDTQDPESPRLVGSYEGLGTVRQVVIRNERAYIAAREFGLWIIDVANPASPQVLSRFDTIELATGVEVSGNVAFVALRVYGVEVIDVSDPRHPRHITLQKTPEAQSAYYSGKKLYVGNWQAGILDIYDVSAPETPAHLSRIQMDGYGDGVEVNGTLCFAATGHHAKKGPKDKRDGRGHGLEIHDIKDPRKPDLLSVTKFPPLFYRFNDFWTVRTSRGSKGLYAFVADTHNGVFLLDVANVRAPLFAGRIELPVKGKLPDAVSGIAIGEGVIYITGVKTGLYVARLPAGMTARDTPAADKSGELVYIPEKRKRAGGREYKDWICYPVDGQVRGAVLRGPVAYVAASHAGLHAVRLGDRFIEPVRKWDIPDVYDVRIHGDYLYTAEGMKGLGIYKIEDDNALRLVGHMAAPPGQLLQQIRIPEGSRFAVLSTRTGILHFADIADPERPELVWSHRQISLLYHDYLANGPLLDGRWTALNWHSGGLAWYDLGGDKPEPGNTLVERLAGHTDGMAVLGNKLFYIIRGKYVLLDPNQPGPSASWPQHGLTGDKLAGFPTAHGNLVALSDRLNRRIRILDFSDPAHPEPIPGRDYQLEGTPDAVVFWRDRMVVPAGYQGLLIERR